MQPYIKLQKKQCPHCLGEFNSAGYARWHGDNCIQKKKKGPFPWLAVVTLTVAACIAGVSAWYSILGLITIFAGAALEVAIMASALEVGKLVTAGWLHFRWNVVPFIMKAYLLLAVLVLMFITSIGVFGFLSKAHIEHTMELGGTNDIRIETLERRIGNEQRRIVSSQQVIDQLDSSINTLIDFDRIRGPEGAIAVRQSQQLEREDLNSIIEEAYQRIETLNEELLPLQQQRIGLEAEVGPLKYLAEIVYDSAGKKELDTAVSWLIILLVLVMDPLAVLLTIAGLMTFKRLEVVHIEKPVDALIID